MEKLKKEKEVCGIYISGNPLDGYMQEFKDYNFNSSMLPDETNSETDEEIDEESEETEDELKDGMIVECGGIISEVKKIFTKQTNKPMAILTVEDLYGDFDVMIFNKMYEPIAETLENDKIVHINGKISIRVGDRPIIIATNIEFLDDRDKQKNVAPTKKQPQIFGEDAKKEEPKKIYLRLDLRNKDVVDDICEILYCYEGNSPVFVQHQNKLYDMQIFSDASNSLVAELSALIGPENIKIK